MLLFVLPPFNACYVLHEAVAVGPFVLARFPTRLGAGRGDSEQAGNTLVFALIKCCTDAVLHAGCTLQLLLTFTLFHSLQKNAKCSV